MSSNAMSIGFELTDLKDNTKTYLSPINSINPSLSKKSADQNSVSFKKGNLKAKIQNMKPHLKGQYRSFFAKLVTYTSGFLISSAYMDPGNYSVNVNTGAQNQYALLTVIFLSSCIAVFLQSLCIKLGSVTGMDLAKNCKKNCNKYINFILWMFAQTAIICTDIAEVIGTSIALNILLKIPLYGGVLLTSFDIMLVLIFFRPGGSNSLKIFKVYEFCVAILVIGVAICFAIQLGYLPQGTSVRQIFKGFIPTHALFENDGILNSTSVLGATVMPHSLYVGSSIVLYRLLKYDISKGNFDENDLEVNQSHNTADDVEVTVVDQLETGNGSCSNAVHPTATTKQTIETTASKDQANISENEVPPKLPKENEISEFDIVNSMYAGYKPSIAAINYCIKSSIIELAVTLMTVALFVNCAIIIVAGATLYGSAEATGASIYTIHDLLSKSLSKTVGTVFIIALLLSGECAGMLCAHASCVLDGHLNKQLSNVWQKRLATRGISIIPALVVSLVVGKAGINKTLNVTQVILSVLLPFITLPIFYFTSRSKYMTVVENGVTKDYSNNWITIFLCVIIWVFISTLNMYMIVESA